MEARHVFCLATEARAAFYFSERFFDAGLLADGIGRVPGRYAVIYTDMGVCIWRMPDFMIPLTVTNKTAIILVKGLDKIAV